MTNIYRYGNIIYTHEKGAVFMKALIFSDSHGSVSDMFSAIEENHDADLIIFAGDVQRDIDEVCDAYPRIPCAVVLGNNDFFVHDVPFDRFFEFGGKKIFLTHGHSYGVKLSPARVIAEAREKGADICIFGHTHSRFFENNDIWVINPGPAGRGYAVLTIDKGEISVDFKDI